MCGYGWTENTLTGECYRLVLEELSFGDARLECREYYYDEEYETRPDLVSIYSSQEQSSVFSKLGLHVELAKEFVHMLLVSVVHKV